MDCSPPGSSVHRILQAKILEWVAISSSRGSSWPRDWTWVSCIAGRFFTVWATRETPVTFPFTSIYSLPYSIVCAHSVVSNSVTPRTIACQVPLSMEFSRQEYWSELPFPTPGDLPDPGIEPMFLEGGNSWVESERINKRRKRRPFQWEWTVWRKLQRPEISH